MATSRPARTAGWGSSRAASSAACATRSGGPTPFAPKRDSYSTTAASPRAATPATIFATSPPTDSPAGTSARTRAATAAAVATVHSARTEALQHAVDLLRLHAIGDRVGDQPRRRRRDLLADHQAVLAQGRPRRGQVDDPVHEAGEGRELDGALHLHDLRLAAGALEVARGDARVLRRDAHDAEPPQRLPRGVLALDRGEHHAAAAVAEVKELVHVALALLGEDVLAGDAQVGGARLDVGRDVGRPHGDDARLGEEQLAVVGADLGGVDAEAVERVERLLEQRPAGNSDAQGHRPSCRRAAWTRSTSSAQPQAGSSRPKRPSRSS